jgi:hypothetical protein
MEELKAAGLIGGRAPISLRETALPHEVPQREDTEAEETAPELEALVDEEEMQHGGGE